MPMNSNNEFPRGFEADRAHRIMMGKDIYPKLGLWEQLLDSLGIGKRDLEYRVPKNELGKMYAALTKADYDKSSIGKLAESAMLFLQGQVVVSPRLAQKYIDSLVNLYQEINSLEGTSETTCSEEDVYCLIGRCSHNLLRAKRKDYISLYRRASYFSLDS